LTLIAKHPRTRIASAYYHVNFIGETKSRRFSPTIRPQELRYSELRYAASSFSRFSLRLAPRVERAEGIAMADARAIPEARALPRGITHPSLVIRSAATSKVAPPSVDGLDRAPGTVETFNPPRLLSPTHPARPPEERANRGI